MDRRLVGLGAPSGEEGQIEEEGNEHPAGRRELAAPASDPA